MDVKLTGSFQPLTDYTHLFLETNFLFALLSLLFSFLLWKPDFLLGSMTKLLLLGLMCSSCLIALASTVALSTIPFHADTTFLIRYHINYDGLIIQFLFFFYLNAGAPCKSRALKIPPKQRQWPPVLNTTYKVFWSCLIYFIFTKICLYFSWGSHRTTLSSSQDASHLSVLPVFSYTSGGCSFINCFTELNNSLDCVFNTVVLFFCLL